MKPRAFFPALIAGTMLVTANTAAEEYLIVIGAMKFAAPSHAFKVGDLIIWRNDDILRHTATDRSSSFEIDLEPSTEARLTLAASGTFQVFCRFHPGMTVNLIVEP